jgi:hypothetical protein
VYSKYVGRHTQLPDVDEKHNYRLPMKINYEPTSHCPLGSDKLVASECANRPIMLGGGRRRRSRRRKILNKG